MYNDCGTSIAHMLIALHMQQLSARSPFCVCSPHLCMASVSSESSWPGTASSSSSSSWPWTASSSSSSRAHAEASPAPSCATTEMSVSTPPPDALGRALTRSAALADLSSGGRASRPRKPNVEAGADFEPVQLDFSNAAEDEDIIERDLLDAIDGDTDAAVHELPEPDEPGCSRAPYQRFLSQYRRWVQRQLALEEDDAGRARLSAKLSMKARTPAQKTRLAQQFWSDPACGTSEEDKAAILAKWREKTQNPGRQNRWFRQCAGLWTYNGDWGIMEEITVPMTRSASAQDEIQWVVHQCQNSKRLLEIWKDFEKFWAKIVEKYHFAHFAIAFELCTKTLEESRAVRVHAHVAARAFQRVSIEYADLLKWQGGVPHISRGFSASRQRQAGSNSCFYYLQCPKIGVIYQAANVRPFDDYLVSGEWVFNLLQQQKMTISDARQQCVRSAKNLQRVLPNLEAYERAVNAKNLQQHIDKIQTQLASESKPFLRIESIERWKEDHVAVKPRYKFLVLVGPSGLGKTQYAKSLVENGRALELNMAAAPEPDLKEYHHDAHDLVLFDECPAKVILRQKKLFQAPAAKVSLAASATGCYSYSVWVHQKLLVVCSNVWHHELRSLPHEDVEWLVSNSLVYSVDRPLWTQDAAPLGDPLGSVGSSMGDTP